MSPLKSVVLAALAAGTAACTVVNPAPAPSPPAAGMSAIACAAPLKPAVEHQIYFGRDRGPRGEISEAQWQRFVNDVVTPRFPDGLSIINVAGQSRTGTANTLLRERTKLLIVVAPAAAGARITEIADAYRKQFDQRAVFRVDRPVCASL